MTYVMSDLHGLHKQFLKMLKKIKFSENDTLYIIGDVVDRGPDSAKLLSYIMATPNIILLMGNHEYFLLDYFSRKPRIPNLGDIMDEYDYEVWYRNGGMETVKSLRAEEKNLPLEKVVDFIKSLEFTKVLKIGDKQFVLGHANIPSKDGYLVTAVDQDTLLWERRLKSKEDILLNNVWLITGHTHTKGTIEIHENWICIDCGAVYGLSMGCLRLDDMMEFYI